jgi:hypothetical protein
VSIATKQIDFGPNTIKTNKNNIIEILRSIEKQYTNEEEYEQQAAL